MRTSESIAAIAPAFAKAQGQFSGASKDSKNPHFGSKYADLASVFDAVRKPLADNALSLLQDATVDDHGVSVVTKIIHGSGEWYEFGPLVIPVSKRDAHGVGSAITYGKRYAAQAALGVASEDDDGNAAQAAPPRNESPAETAPRNTIAGREKLAEVSAYLKRLGSGVDESGSDVQGGPAMRLALIGTILGRKVQASDLQHMTTDDCARVLSWAPGEEVSS